MEVSVVSLMKYHPFFCILSAQTIKEMFKILLFVKVSNNQFVYNERYPATTFYYLISG